MKLFTRPHSLCSVYYIHIHILFCKYKTPQAQLPEKPGIEKQKKDHIDSRFKRFYQYIVFFELFRLNHVQIHKLKNSAKYFLTVFYSSTQKPHLRHW